MGLMGRCGLSASCKLRAMDGRIVCCSVISS